MSRICGRCGGERDEYACSHCGFTRNANNNGWCASCGQVLWKAVDPLLDAEWASATHGLVCPRTLDAGVAS